MKMKKATVALLVLLLSACGRTGGGAAPAPTSKPFTTLSLEALRMFTATSGWAIQAKSGHVLKTADGARHWTDITPWSGPVYRNEAYSFVNDLDAWVLAMPASSSSFAPGAVIFRTSDGGRTWQHRGEVFLSGPPQLQAIDLNNAWIYSEGPCTTQCIDQSMTIVRTSDGGSHWTNIMNSPILGRGSPGALPPTCEKASGLSFVTPARGWASGQCLSGPPFFFMTNDGGLSWSRVDLPASPSLLNCRCEVGPVIVASPTTAFVLVNVAPTQPNQISATLLYATSDQGKTWALKVSPVTTPFDQPNFISGSDGWMTDGTTLYVTKAGGSRWNSIIPSVSLGAAHLNFVTSGIGFAIVLSADGSESRVYETVDGGYSWISVVGTLD